MTETQTHAGTAPTRAEALVPHYRAKPWGRPDGLAAPAAAQPLGEVVFDASGAGLIIKWIQTRAPLSIQVHPRGEGRKHEWWYVAEAHAGSYLYLGLREPASPGDIARAAGEGRLPDLLRRIEPKAGDTFFVEAGSLHALGPGLTVLEVQEPSEVTWRLYDYGRGRELHLDEALREAILMPRPLRTLPGDEALFRVECKTLAAAQEAVLGEGGCCMTIVEGSGTVAEQSYTAHQCWRIEGPVAVRARESTITVVAAAGGP